MKKTNHDLYRNHCYTQIHLSYLKDHFINYSTTKMLRYEKPILLLNHFCKTQEPRIIYAKDAYGGPKNTLFGTVLFGKILHNK